MTLDQCMVQIRGEPTKGAVMSIARAYGTNGPTENLKPMEIERRAPDADDVQIDIAYCGVCHSDIHTARSEWGPSQYPCVPGHEIIGRVRAIGKNVDQFVIGDLVGVGCMVDSCGKCDSCERGLEQYCDIGSTFTYNSSDIHLGGQTFGGYSSHMVVKSSFVVPIPSSLDPMHAAPLLCAGITSYSPMRHWNVGPGMRLGIAGFGGIGEIATKIAKAMGAHVTVMTFSKSKRDAALAAGADNVLVMSDSDAVRSAQCSLDFIFSTVPRSHNVNPYLSSLALDGTLVLVGCLNPLEEPVEAGLLIGKRRALAGSVIGGIAETREMLEFCAEHGIVPKVECIAIDKINTAYNRMVASEMSHRFVIDMATL